MDNHLKNYILGRSSIIKLNKFVGIPGKVEKTDKIPETDYDGSRVDARMKAYFAGELQVLVQKQMNGMVFIVDKAKRSNRTGSESQIIHQPFIGSKSKFALMQAMFQIMNIHNMSIFENYKIMTVAFMITKKQVLAVRCRYAFPESGSYFNRWSFGMFVIFERNI